MKRVVSFFVAMVMVFCAFSFVATTVSAAEAGTLSSNAIVLTDNKWYTKYWTNSNYSLNCYNKIQVPSRGYITFTMEKPYDTEGEIGEFYFYLYDANGVMIWSADTGDQAEQFSANYEYKIGLNAGTYYMNLDPSFYVQRNSGSIRCSYKYAFTKSNVWEIENNNTKRNATQINFNTTYYGVYGEESFQGTYDDYYKFKLTKGSTYTIYLKNAAELDAGTTIVELHDPNGNEVGGVSLRSGKEGTDYRSWSVKAKYTGWYYFLLRNDANGVGTNYAIRVNAPKIAASKTTATLTRTGYAYDGKVKTPAVTVKYGNKTLTKGTDYTVSYASGRKNVGQYKVVITYKGSYTGTKTLYFKIYPPKTTLSTVATSGSKALKITWAKKSTQVTGYQIQYSTSSKFASGNKTKTVSSYKTTSTTIKSLTAKKTYYVRVRTYKTVGGKTYYSSWSNVKYKKTT